MTEADREVGSEAAEPADERSTLATVASHIAGAAEHLATGARRLIAERPGARIRRVRRMAGQPLVNLWELHPEARQAR